MKTEKIPLSRREKRGFNIGVRENEMRLIEYIDSLAVKLHQKFPKTISKRDAYQRINKAFMKRGNPSDATHEATKILRECMLKCIPKWRNRMKFRFLFFFLQVKLKLNQFSLKKTYIALKTKVA